MNLGEKIAASKDNWERRPQDYYDTPTHVTQALLQYMSFPRALRIREPCCGEGYISEVLRRAGHDVVSSDLEYRGYGEGGVDYLTLPEVDPENYDMDAVVTNPPFSIAEKIIRRALRDAPIVAMLLPSGYWHAEKRAVLFETRRPEVVLPLLWRPVFAPERGQGPLMNVMWVVWIDDTSYEGPAKRLTSFDLLHRPTEEALEIPVSPSVRIGRTGALGPLENALTAAIEAR